MQNIDNIYFQILKKLKILVKKHRSLTKKVKYFNLVWYWLANRAVLASRPYGVGKYRTLGTCQQDCDLTSKHFS